MKQNPALLLTLLCLLGASCFGLKAASFSFSSGAGTVESLVLFESEDGNPLSGGYLFAGTYSTSPTATATHSELLSNFVSFAPLSSNPANGSGLFSGGTFTGSLGGLPSSKIYLLVVNDADISAATQFAVFSSSSSSWIFPSSDFDLSVSIALPAVDQYFAGAPDMIAIGGGGDFNSIQLTTVAEPEPLVLPSVCFVVSGGRPGIEFEFPTSQAGNFSFVLQESDGGTLLEADWTDVVASPSVVSDDGTTQVIRIIHPALLSSESERFFRLVGS